MNIILLKENVERLYMYKKRYVVAFLFLLSMHSQTLSAQVFLGASKPDVKEKFSLIYDFLKNNHTDALMHADSNNFRKTLIYDSVINLFFNRASMIRKIGESDLVTVNTQYQIIQKMDQLIDIIPKDSIFIIDSKTYYVETGPKKKGNEQYLNKYLIGFLIEGKRYPIGEVEMDASHKFVYAMPLIFFEKEEGQNVQQFIERQARLKKVDN